MAWMARRMQIFGVHYHVGVRSPEKAVAIANALSFYIPHFLALSASSPFWNGHDTGLASSRSKVFEGLPTAGLPQMLGSWEQFQELMTTLISAKAISSIREIWWDIRPHPNFGTVELRICDGLPTMTEITTVAALAQCLVEWMDSLLDRGYTLPCPKAWIVGQNKWRAARYGIDADIIVDEQGTLEPLARAITDLVEELTPVARRLGCEKELEHARRILDHGPSYLRQRRWVEAGATPVDVVDRLIGELRSDEPG
jgi:carboxylate-amine ligase